MRNLPHLQTRIFDTPLCIQPEKLEVILSVLGDRIGLEIDASEFEAARAAATGERKSYSVTKDGIAVIPIQGTLMKKTSGLMAMSGCSSYESIMTQLEDAITAPNVKGILLDIDSPGGETHGLFDLSDFIYSMRGQKPMYAVANDGAYSAAYAIASSADRIFVTRTGGVGSIGVFCLHVDQSKADAKAGLSYTYIKAGEKKADGNSHEPLSDSALADSQAEVDREYQMFCSLVARNRKVSVEKVMNTEAGVFFAENALPTLADQVGTFDDALAALSGRLTGVTGSINTISGHKATMANETNVLVPAATEVNEAVIAATEIDSAVEPAEEVAITEPKAIEAKACDEADADPEEEEDIKEDVEDEVEATKSASLTRIVNLCTLAGHSDLAASYIKQNFTVAQVEKLLLDKRSMKSNETKLNTNLPTSASAFDTLNSLAAEVQKQTGVKKSEAFAKMLTANAESYQAYLEERDEACARGLNSKNTRTYLAEITSKVRGN